LAYLYSYTFVLTRQYSTKQSIYQLNMKLHKAYVNAQHVKDQKSHLQ